MADSWTLDVCPFCGREVGELPRHLRESSTCREEGLSSLSNDREVTAR